MPTKELLPRKEAAKDLSWPNALELPSQLREIHHALVAIYFL